MPYVYLDPADYDLGKAISFEEYAQLVENANQAYGAGTNHGEVFATRSAISSTGISVSGSTPGPYTLTVPAGVTQMELDGVGGGGSGAGNTAGNAGGASTVSGSTSGTLATFNGGAAGAGPSGAPIGGAAGGAASGRANAGGTATVAGPGVGAPCRGGYAAGPFIAGDPLTSSGYGGDAPSNGAGTGYGSGGGTQTTIANYLTGGGGGAAGKFVITVIPGETLTLTVGAGGAAVGGNSKAGAPGMLRLKW